MKCISSFSCYNNCSCQVNNCGNNEGLQEFSSSDYTCLSDHRRHNFCNQHKWFVRCPVHPKGCKRCQVPDCLSEAKKYYFHNDYTCLSVGEYHYFGDKHSQLKDCPIHKDGKRRCEVTDCFQQAKKYSRAYYSCLCENEYHFFCEQHAKDKICPTHKHDYKTV